jgi:hypothetical protein
VPGRPAPKVEIVLELEELAIARIVAFNDGDERRLLADLESGSDVSSELAAALVEAMRVLRDRAGAR